MQVEHIESAINLLPLIEQQHLLERLSRKFEQRVLNHSPQPVVELSTEAHRIDADHFRLLADQWRRETEHISSLKQACLHPAYQRIIGMGPAAVPLLLRELEQAPDHWFWALNAITEEDPAQTEDSLEGATRAWLTWGKEKGHI